MADSPPIAEQLSSPSGTPLTALSWSDALRRMADNGDYLLATSGPGGDPHVVPVLAVLTDGELCFTSGREARKARHLARNAGCALTVPGPDLDLVVEGTAHLVRDAARLQRVADAYPVKYPWWHPVVRNGEFHDPADTDLTDPQPIYAVTPKTVFAFGKEDGFSATRWRP